MKYIDSDKLIAEIERRIEETKSMKPSFDQFWAGQISAFKGAIKIAESLQQEQPKFDVGDLVVSKKNPHLTYRILATNIPNELGKTDYMVEIFTDGKPGLLDEPHNIHLISSDKIEEWGEFVQQEQPEVDLEDYISNKLRELGADLINHKPYSFNRGLNVGKANAYNDILNRLNTRKEE